MLEQGRAEESAHHRNHRTGRFVPRRALLGNGYEVVGMVRRSSTVNFERIAHIQDHIQVAR